MNRRSFLSIIAGSGGSCLIPAAIARRIRDREQAAVGEVRTSSRTIVLRMSLL